MKKLALIANQKETSNFTLRNDYIQSSIINSIVYDLTAQFFNKKALKLLSTTKNLSQLQHPPNLYTEYHKESKKTSLILLTIILANLLKYPQLSHTL